MNINNAFPSKYVKASEIPEEGIGLTIDRVEVEDVDGKGGRKPVLYFRKAKKGLVLNVTNSKKIQQIIGTPDTDEWVGRGITLYQSETEYAGETVPCIRVRANKTVPKAVPKPQPKPEPEPESDGELVTELNDSDIPF